MKLDPLKIVRAVAGKVAVAALTGHLKWGDIKSGIVAAIDEVEAELGVTDDTPISISF